MHKTSRQLDVVGQRECGVGGQEGGSGSGGGGREVMRLHQLIPKWMRMCDQRLQRGCGDATVWRLFIKPTRVNRTPPPQPTVFRHPADRRRPYRVGRWRELASAFLLKWFVFFLWFADVVTLCVEQKCPIRILVFFPYSFANLGVRMTANVLIRCSTDFNTVSSFSSSSSFLQDTQRERERERRKEVERYTETRGSRRTSAIHLGAPVRCWSMWTISFVQLRLVDNIRHPSRRLLCIYFQLPPIFFFFSFFSSSSTHTDTHPSWVIQLDGVQRARHPETFTTSSSA